MEVSTKGMTKQKKKKKRGLAKLQDDIIVYYVTFFGRNYMYYNLHNSISTLDTCEDIGSHALKKNFQGGILSSRQKRIERHTLNLFVFDFFHTLPWPVPSLDERGRGLCVM